MLLHTFAFLVFFACVLVVYWRVSPRFQWMVLLAASYYFYGSWKPAYLGLIVLTTLVSYYAALAMHRSQLYRKTYLLVALVVNFSVLFVFKYFNFFAYEFFHTPRLSLLLPIGISFYTFQVVGYLVDVYRQKIRPEKHLGIFALFACFFPQLAAGPIERGSELLPQLKKPHAFDYSLAASGLRLFAFGLFKKMVVADTLAMVVDRVFESLPVYRGLSLVVVVFFFAWQIYMDFSGYTDMARGVARVLGFRLMENFNTPYLATSVQDFWRRWHMSLSRWFKDYVYIPLGGNKKGIWRTCLNILLVFTLCGLWHGAAWHFVIWGAFHGLVMSLERLASKIVRIQLPQFIRVIYTFLVVSVSWVFFRAPTWADIVYVLRFALVGWRHFVSPAYVWASISQLFVTNRVEMAIGFGVVILAIVIEIASRITSLSRLVDRQPLLIRYLFYIGLVLMVVHLRNASVKEFIYVRF